MDGAVSRSAGLDRPITGADPHPLTFSPLPALMLKVVSECRLCLSVLVPSSTSSCDKVEKHVSGDGEAKVVTKRRPAHSADLAIMLPQQERPAYEHPPNRPHHAGMMHLAQRPSIDGRPLDDHAHIQPAMDFPKPGIPGYPNGHGPQIPNAPPHHRQNGDPRQGGTMSLGGFEGSRSPPTKSIGFYLPLRPGGADHR